MIPRAKDIRIPKRKNNFFIQEKHMRYKFAATDMDGTLLNNFNEITPYTADIIRQAVSAGLIFSICTGRPIEGVSRYLKQLDIQGPVITYNGAMILDSATGKILYRQDLEAEDAR